MAQQAIPNGPTHGDVRTVLESNRTDAETRLAALEAAGGGSTVVVSRPQVIALSSPDASGNAYTALLAGTVNRQVVPAFVKDVDGSWYGSLRIPNDYVSDGRIGLSLAANATTGVARVTVGTVAVAAGESYNPGAFSDETAQDLTMPGTAYLRLDATFPTSGTLASAPAAGDDLLLRITHNGAHANDTLAVDLLVLGVVFAYTGAV
jgi:hypothetical protein